MFTKSIVLALMSLSAFTVALAADVDGSSPAAPVTPAVPAAPAVDAFAEAPPAPAQGRPDRRPDGRPLPRPYNGGRPGYEPYRGRPGFDGIIPVFVPTGPGAPGYAPVGAPGSLELSCELLNIPAYQLPLECKQFCRETARGPWWC